MRDRYEFPIEQEGDISKVRMKTRQMARQAGLPIIDQARISLATSSLAQALELGKGTSARIYIRILEQDAQKGLEVVCITKDANLSEDLLSRLMYGEWRQMVDDIAFQYICQDDLQVTLIKWRPEEFPE